MKTLSLSSLAILICLISFAQEPPTFGGMGYLENRNTNCVPEHERFRINEMLKNNIEHLKSIGKLPDDWGKISNDKQQQATGHFIWPLLSTEGLNYNYGISNFVDLDPQHPDHLLDWNCGDRTYDLATGNHAGVDIFTWPFGQHMQKYDMAKIIAAASGTIIGIDDGHPDNNCTMNSSTPWNAVYIANDDGTVCWYGHMKKNSTLNKQIGDPVVAGEILGIVGSSGFSTGPHLHFETHNSVGDILEPFAGSCNPGESLWAEQRPYHHSKLNVIMTHNHAPYFPDCPQLEEINAKDTFTVGDTLMFAAYFHDQTDEEATHYKIYAPDNSIYSEWSHTSNNSHLNASYWYWFWTYSSAWINGKYKFTASYGGDTLEHTFWVYDVVGVEEIPTIDKSFVLYPNPNSGSFDIKIEDQLLLHSSILKITDVKGSVIIEKLITPSKDNISIELDLPVGMYFLNIIDKNGKNHAQSFIVH